MKQNEPRLSLPSEKIKLRDEEKVGIEKAGDLVLWGDPVSLQPSRQDRPRSNEKTCTSFPFPHSKFQFTLIEISKGQEIIKDEDFSELSFTET